MKVAEASLIKTFMCCVFVISYFRLELSPVYPNEMWAVRIAYYSASHKHCQLLKALLQTDEMSNTVREIVSVLPAQFTRKKFYLVARISLVSASCFICSSKVFLFFF